MASLDHSSPEPSDDTKAGTISIDQVQEYYDRKLQQIQDSCEARVEQVKEVHAQRVQEVLERLRVKLSIEHERAMKEREREFVDAVAAVQGAHERDRAKLDRIEEELQQALTDLSEADRIVDGLTSYLATLETLITATYGVDVLELLQMARAQHHVVKVVTFEIPHDGGSQ